MGWIRGANWEEEQRGGGVLFHTVMEYSRYFFPH